MSFLVLSGVYEYTYMCNLVKIKFFEKLSVFLIDFNVNGKIMTSTCDVTSPETAILNVHHTSSALCLRISKSVK